MKKNEIIDKVLVETIFEQIEQQGEELNKYDYICWLESYTNNKQSFTSDDYSCETDQKTKENISNLPWFYDYIKEYADNNFIQPHKYNVGSYYCIKFNNIGYNIGSKETSSGSYTIFCQRTNILDDFIDYYDIENNIQQINEVSSTTENTFKKVLLTNNKQTSKR